MGVCAQAFVIHRHNKRFSRRRTILGKSLLRLLPPVCVCVRVCMCDYVCGCMLMRFNLGVTCEGTYVPWHLRQIDSGGGVLFSSLVGAHIFFRIGSPGEWLWNCYGAMVFLFSKGFVIQLARSIQKVFFLSEMQR